MRIDDFLYTPRDTLNDCELGLEPEPADEIFEPVASEPEDELRIEGDPEYGIIGDWRPRSEIACGLCHHAIPSEIAYSGYECALVRASFCAPMGPAVLLQPHSGTLTKMVDTESLSPMGSEKLHGEPVYFHESVNLLAKKRWTQLQRELEAAMVELGDRIQIVNGEELIG